MTKRVVCRYYKTIMKRIILPFFLLFFLFFPTYSVSAQTQISSKGGKLSKEAIWQRKKEQFWDWGTNNVQPWVLGEKTSKTTLFFQPKGFLPDQPFYFLKRFRENVGLILTLDPVKKEEKRLAIAQERLAEAGKLFEMGKADLAQKTVVNYTHQVVHVMQNLATLSSEEKKKVLAQKLALISAKHELVFEKTLERVPERARPAVKKAMEVSQKGMDRAADVLHKPPVPPEFKARLESLKRQALITPEEAAMIINSHSREEVREKLRHLLGEGKVPETDFKLLDKAQQLIAPQEFEEIREHKKLEELRKLEARKVPKVVKKKVDKFLQNYHPGDAIPPQLIQYLPFQRVEELKKTIRPEILINEKIKKSKFVGPGGCYNEETCRGYCSQPAHRAECMKFLEKAPDWVKAKAKPSADSGQHLEIMKKLGCRDKTSCQAICRENPDRCREFGFSPQGGEIDKPPAGPGGCRTREDCERFCSNPAHQQEFQKFGSPQGEKGPPSGNFEFEHHQGSEGKKQEEMQGPGGCRSEEECRKYCQEHSQDPQCRRGVGGHQKQEGPPQGEKLPEREMHHPPMNSQMGPPRTEKAPPPSQEMPPGAVRP